MKLYIYDNKSLIFKPLKIIDYIKYIAFIGFIFGGLSFTGTIKFNNAIEKIPVIVKLNKEKFTPELLKKEIESLKIQHPDIVFAQCQIESANFTSNIWKQNNNCVGMKLAQTRATTAIGEQFNHALYKNWRDCLIDYSIWQMAYAKNLSKEEYLQLLHEIYAENKNYVTLIKQKL